MRVGLLAVCVVLGVAACNHRQYRYQPKAPETGALDALISQFQRSASAPGEKDALFRRVDLQGRVALLDLLRHSLMRREAMDGRSRELLAVAVLVVRGGERSGRPFTEPELKTAALGALDALEGKLSEELDLEPAELQVLAILLGIPKPPNEEARAEAVRAALSALALRECEAGEPRVSYRADLLRELDEPKSEHWTRWRRGLQSLHLITLRCADSHGAILLSRHERESAPRVVAWQFFAPDEWSVIQSRLEKLLGEGG